MNLPSCPHKYCALYLVMATALITVEARAISEEGFARYQVILSRKPFGDPPHQEAPVEVPPQPVPAAESFARNLRICSITQPVNHQAKVGIVDKGAKNAVFILREGEESPNGIKLVSADVMEEEAVLQKGDEIVMLKLGENPVTQLSKQDLAKRTSARRPTKYADRRKQRREKLLAQKKKAQQKDRVIVKPPAPKYTGDALRKHLQEYNMQAIREGFPALPIELTPEQDLQLVTEGILEPADGGSSPVPAPGIFPPAAAAGLLDNLPEALNDLPIDDLTPEERIELEELFR